METPVYYFFHGYLPGVEFFDLWCYVYIVEEVPEDIIFDITEKQSCKRAVMKLTNGTEVENLTISRDEEGKLPVLPSGTL